MNDYSDLRRCQWCGGRMYLYRSPSLQHRVGWSPRIEVVTRCAFKRDEYLLTARGEVVKIPGYGCDRERILYLEGPSMFEDALEVEEVMCGRIPSAHRLV